MARRFSRACFLQVRFCSDRIGTVVGFDRTGGPLVRLESEGREVPQEAQGNTQVVLSNPNHALLMRGQMLKLGYENGNWKILNVLEGPRRKKCIHPTRVAGLCKICPRRTKAK